MWEMDTAVIAPAVGLRRWLEQNGALSHTINQAGDRRLLRVMPEIDRFVESTRLEEEVLPTRPLPPMNVTSGEDIEATNLSYPAPIRLHAGM
jgi:hypothetical protein